MSVTSHICETFGATELVGLIENMTSLMICAISPCWASIAIFVLTSRSTKNSRVKSIKRTYLSHSSRVDSLPSFSHPYPSIDIINQRRGPR